MSTILVNLIKQKNAQVKLEKPETLLFGADGNGDGKRDLYVTSGEEAGSASILRVNGQTGEFIDVFISDNLVHLVFPLRLWF